MDDDADRAPGHWHHADIGELSATRPPTDARTDDALRALARILARQAARDIFNRKSKAVGSDRATDEDQQ